MGTGYTRADVANNIADGNIVNASDLDNEYDAIEAAFNSSTGHTHDGTSAEGGPITVVGPVQDLVVSATEVKPKTTNTLDLGTSALLYKDAYLQGNMYFRDTALKIVSSADGQLDIDADVEVEITAPTLDIDASTAVTINTTTLALSGDMTFGDNDKAIFGAGSDLQIYHDASHSYIRENGTGNLRVLGTDFDVRNSGNTASMLKATDGGAVNINYNGNTKLATTNTGIDVTGDATFADNGKAIFGAGSDLQIYHDGSGSYVSEVGVGSLFIDATNLRLRDASSNLYLLANSGGEVGLYYNGSKKIETTNTGVDVTGTITFDGGTTSADLNFGDNDKAVFGAGSDLQIYHDGSNSYISDQGTGNLRILAEDFRVVNAANSETMIQANVDSDVRLYYDSSPKLATTATGIDVTGTMTADGLTVDGAGVIRLNPSSGDDFLTLTQGGTQAVITADSTAGAGNLVFRTTSAGSDTDTMLLAANGDISFYDSTGVTQGLFWDASTQRLGLGTTSPSNKLSIANNNYIAWKNNVGSSETIAIRANTSDGLEFLTGTTRMTITSGGNVGIGTSSLENWDSSWVATQVGSGSSLVGASGATSRTFLSDNAYADGSNQLTSWKYMSTNEASLYAQLDGTHSFRVASSGTADTAITWSEAMTIDSSGNVAIGTTSSDGKLHVHSSSAGTVTAASDANQLVLESTTNVGMSFLTGNTSTARIKFGDPDATNSGTISYVHSDDSLRFNAGGAQRIRIDSDGLKFGTDTAAANALDDYEEGTFTPVVADASSGGNTGTASQAYGYYTKVGRNVTIHLNMTNIDTTGLTAGNDVYIQGLPFASLAVTGSITYNGSIWGAAVDLSATGPYLVPAVADGQSAILLKEWGDNTGTDNLTVSELTSGTSDLNISLSYQTS